MFLKNGIGKLPSVADTVRWSAVSRAFCDRPRAPGAPKVPASVKVDAKGKTNEKKPAEKVVEEVGDHINPITGEIGGPKGPEPTRYGDWERKGRCSDF